MSAGHDDAFGQEVQAVVDGWRAVLGPDFPSDGPFDINGIDIRLAQMADQLRRRPPAYEMPDAGSQYHGFVLRLFGGLVDGAPRLRP